MTSAARIVLSDCRLALNEFKNALEQSTFETIRIRWLTCLTLLRAVGHVLQKVDEAKYNSNEKEKAKNLHGLRKKDKIFEQFIEAERNLMLKQYKHHLKYDEKIKKEGGDYLCTEDGTRLVTESGDFLITETKEWIQKNITKIDGHKKDYKPDEIIQEAIEWWEKELDKADKISN